jgi:hypothetical protein
MRKLLAIILLLLITGASAIQNTWTASDSATNVLWSNGANWSTALKPGTNDTVTLDASGGSKSPSVDENVVVKKMLVQTTYTRALSFAGYSITSSGGGIRFNGCSSLHWGDTVILNGASDTFYLGSTVGTLAADKLSILKLNCTSAGVYQVEKVTHWKQIIFGPNFNIRETNVGFAATGVNYNGNCVGAPVIFENGGTLYHDRQLHIYSPDSFFNIQSTAPSLVTYADFKLTTAGNNKKSKLCALTNSGTGYIGLNYAGSYDTATLGGNLNWGTASARFYGDGGFWQTFDANDYNVTCGELWFGNYESNKYLAKWGNGTWNVGNYRGDQYNADNSIDSMEGSHVNTPIWKVGSNHTYSGTFTLHSNGTGTYTTLSKLMYDILRDDAGSGYLTLADSLNCHNLTQTNGAIKTSYGIRCTNFSVTASDSVNIKYIRIDSNYTRGPSANKMDTSGQHIWLSAGVSHVVTTNGQQHAQVTMAGPMTTVGNLVTRVLTWASNGLKWISTAGTTSTITTLSGLGGAAGALDSLTGASAWNLALAGTQSLTLSYLYVKNCQLSAGDSLILTDGTSLDGGGNSGNVRFPSSGSTGRRNRGWLGLRIWNGL